MSVVKSYSVTVEGGGECLVSPTVATFSIDEESARLIGKLSELVKSHGLHRVERYDYSARFHQFDPVEEAEEAADAGDDNDVRTECERLVVEATEFYFKADVRHTDETVTSARQSIAEMLAHFGLSSQQPDAAGVIVEQLGAVDAVHKCDAEGAVLFINELLQSVESLDGIVEAHGLRTLTDLMFLQQAILKGEAIDVWPGETHVGKVLEGMPSAERWLSYTQLGGDWKQACVRVKTSIPMV